MRSTPSMAKNKASPKMKFQSLRTETNKLQLGFCLKPLDCFVSDQTYSNVLKIDSAEAGSVYLFVLDWSNKVFQVLTRVILKILFSGQSLFSHCFHSIPVFFF